MKRAPKRKSRKPREEYELRCLIRAQRRDDRRSRVDTTAGMEPFIGGRTGEPWVREMAREACGKD